MDLNTPIISKIIDNWIDEDIGRGDLTSSSITEENGNAYWIAKEEGIFCGVEIIKEIFVDLIKTYPKKLNNIKFNYNNYDLSKINLVPALWKGQGGLAMLPNYEYGMNFVWKKVQINKPNGINLDIKKCVYTPPPTCVCPDGEVDETRCYYEGQTSCKSCSN